MESPRTNSLKLLLLNLLCFFLLILFCFFHHSVKPSKPTPPFPKEAMPTKSGYLQVNPTSNSAIFYAFYEAQHPTSPLSQTPLLIWLQGGPGCSSMGGNFFELGPWRIITSHKRKPDSLPIEPNPGAWNRIFGLVFLDNPIGVGFSVASKPEEIPRDQVSVAKHLFAGKYVPSIGYYILRRNAKLHASQRVNLAGVAIGDGLTDPVTQVATHALNAYYIGLMNEKQKHEVEKLQMEAIRLTQMGNWSEATDARNKALGLLQNMTGLATLYVYTKKAPYETHFISDGVVQVEASVKTMKWEGIVEFLNAERNIWKMNGELAGYVQKWGSLTNVVVLGAGHISLADQPVNCQAMIEDWVLDKGLFGNVPVQHKNVSPNVWNDAL